MDEYNNARKSVISELQSIIGRYGLARLLSDLSSILIDTADETVENCGNVKAARKMHNVGMALDSVCMYVNKYKVMN